MEKREEAQSSILTKKSFAIDTCWEKEKIGFLQWSIMGSINYVPGQASVHRRSWPTQNELHVLCCVLLICFVEFLLRFVLVFWVLLSFCCFDFYFLFLFLFRRKREKEHEVGRVKRWEDLREKLEEGCKKLNMISKTFIVLFPT